MTVVAVVAARDVRQVFAGRCHAIMTGAATADDLGMIDDDDWHEYRGAVTVFTDVRRLDMRRILADCLSTVMAVDAIGGYQAVIKCRRQPSRGSVAIIAGVATRDMCRLFAYGCDAVMARPASTNDLGVINRHYRCENVGCVAVLADVR